MDIWRAGIDAAGTKEEGAIVSRVEEAYDWWIQNFNRARGKVFLCKGSSRKMPGKLSIGKVLETTPNGRQINRYGMQIIELNTQVLKRLFNHAIKQAQEKASGAAYLHKDMDPRYFKHITAESEDDSGNFVRIRPDNHWFDCEAMQHALISRELHGGIERISQRRPQPAPAPTPKPPTPTENPYTTGRMGDGMNPYTRR